MTLRIGYKASSEQFGPGRLADFAVQAEELGFDSVFASDHVQPWRVHGGHAPAVIPWLAHVAARTQRVLLGTSVLTPTFRYHPAVIAHEFATLGCLHPERIILGVGTGEALNEVAVGAVRDGWPPFRERYARLREAVHVIRGLWTTPGFSYEGDYYRIDEVTLVDRPERPLSIYIAAGGPIVAGYAGRAGDGFICTSGKGEELYRDKLVPAFEAGLARADAAAAPAPAPGAAAGPDRPGVDRMLELKISYDRDPQRALENTRFWAPLALTAEQKTSVTGPVEMERLADQLPLAQIASRWIVASDPQTALAGIQPYLDLGFTHLVVHGPGDDQERFLGQFAQDVLPALHASSA